MSASSVVYTTAVTGLTPPDLEGFFVGDPELETFYRRFEPELLTGMGGRRRALLAG